MSTYFFETAENAIFVRLAGLSIVVSSLKYMFTSYFRLFTRAKTYSVLILFESLVGSVLIGLTVYCSHGLLGAVT